LLLLLPLNPPLLMAGLRFDSIEPKRVLSPFKEELIADESPPEDLFIPFLERF